MSSKPDDYPAEWDSALGITRAAEPVAVALEAFVATLTDTEFDALVKRTRH